MKVKILVLILFSQMLLSKIDFIDRIAIIVDNGIIMESEVNNAIDEALTNLRNANAQIPPKEFLFQSIVERLIMDEILLQKAIKLLINCSPYLELFSGWNWHANIFSLITDDVKSISYVVVEEISSLDSAEA